MEHVSLHGSKVPALGLGTWLLEGEDCRRGERLVEPPFAPDWEE